MPIETGPEHPFQHISRNVNKIVEQMQKGYYNFRPNDTWAPNVNLYETEDTYLVCVDLAGVDKEKIDLELIDSRLSIRGRAKFPATTNPPLPTPPLPPSAASSAFTSWKSTMATFFREVELPEHVLKEKIEAHYRNGMLWIEIPKR